MMSSNKRAESLQKIIYLILLMIGAACILFPVAFLINTALKTNHDFINDPMALTTNPQWYNFVEAWKTAKIGKYIFNSIYMSLLSATVTCVISALAAYPISRNHFKGSQKVYTYFLSSMFFPGSLVATIALIKGMNLYNTQLGVILLWSMGGIALNVFMMTGFIKGLPRELDEAAFIDGCGYFRYIITFALPLMKPIIATVFIFRVIGTWNDFITAYLFITDDAKRPVTSGLYLFIGQYATDWTLMAASILIVALPMIVLYVFLQKYIIAGMTSGALKG